MNSAYVTGVWLYTCTECTLDWKHTLRNQFPPPDRRLLLLYKESSVLSRILSGKDGGSCDKTWYVFLKIKYAPPFTCWLLILSKDWHQFLLYILFECYTHDPVKWEMAQGIVCKYIPVLIGTPYCCCCGFCFAHRWQGVHDCCCAVGCTCSVLLYSPCSPCYRVLFVFLRSLSQEFSNHPCTRSFLWICSRRERRSSGHTYRSLLRPELYLERRSSWHPEGC